MSARAFPFKAVIFDFDGVLADSVDIKTGAFAKLFESYGPHVVRRVVDYHRQHGGVSRFDKFRYYYKEVISEPLPDERFEELCQDFESLVLEGVMAADEIPGALDCLKELAPLCDLFVVSGAPHNEMSDIVKARGLEQFFKGVFGSPVKKAEHVRFILNKYGYKADEVVFLGDAMTDYNAALETGIRFLGVHTTEQERFWQGRGVTSIPDMKSCRRTLENLG